MEDDPNSPDLQKRSQRGGDGRVSPSAGHRCAPARPGEMFSTDFLSKYAVTPSVVGFSSLINRQERQRSETILEFSIAAFSWPTQ